MRSCLQLLAACLLFTYAELQPDELPNVLNCASTLSRKARAVVNEAILPVTAEFQYALPAACPFHAANDKLAATATSSKFLRKGRYGCSICDKVFSAQNYLDKHIINKHTDLFPTNATVCLADYCDVLRCESDAWASEAPTVATPAICNQNAMDKRRFFCEKVMQTCFPTATLVGHQLNDAFNTYFCAPLTCDAGAKPMSRAAFLRKYTSQWTISRVMYFVTMCFVVVAVIAFYCYMAKQRKRRHVERELERLRQRRAKDEARSSQQIMQYLPFLSGATRRRTTGNFFDETSARGENADLPSFRQ